ncbi:hypothetical protein NKG05_17320 [Oerskovia sp. M15]
MTETPQTARTQPVYVVVAVLFVVLVALAVWAVSRPSTGTGTGTGAPVALSDGDAMTALEEKVGALDGVESVTVEHVEGEGPTAGRRCGSS